HITRLLYVLLDSVIDGGDGAALHCSCIACFCLHDPATTGISPLSLHDALPILQNTWPYGYSMPIAVRYTQDAFSRSGWLWPVDAKGEPLKATSYMAVGFYVAKYVNKKSDMDLAAKGLGAKEWNNSLK